MKLSKTQKAGMKLAAYCCIALGFWIIGVSFGMAAVIGVNDIPVHPFTLTKAFGLAYLVSVSALCWFVSCATIYRGFHRFERDIIGTPTTG